MNFPAVSEIIPLDCCKHCLFGIWAFTGMEEQLSFFANILDFEILQYYITYILRYGIHICLDMQGP